MFTLKFTPLLSNGWIQKKPDTLFTNNDFFFQKPILWKKIHNINIFMLSFVIYFEGEILLSLIQTCFLYLRINVKAFCWQWNMDFAIEYNISIWNMRYMKERKWINNKQEEKQNRRMWKRKDKQWRRHIMKYVKIRVVC